VRATGKATKLGTLAEGLKTVKPPKTPLQKAMKELSGKLVWVAVFFSVAIPLIGVLQGQPLRTMVLTGLSLSFATIPEELPIIITMVLGLGSLKLSKEAFLVKRLAAAETMGAVSVIVTDKTGTLTQGRMTLTGVHSPRAEIDAVALAMGAVSPIDDTPVDVAIKERAAQLEVPADERDIVRQRELGDGSKTKAVLREDGTLYVSGAPEQVFERCSAVPEEIRVTFESEAANGNREVAVAMGRVPDADKNAAWGDLERGLEFVALLSFSDPPRAEVPGAIARMQSAGVRTIMVTGDYPATASAVANAVGISNDARTVMTGAELDQIDDATLAVRVRTTAVFARTTPEHKYRIVSALQKQGLVAAATGDGINDALALKGADVGIAMGIRGTDVAKEAADVVLADDNYATIANAIFEGRVFFDNLRKGVKYYLSVKTALIAVFLLPAVLGMPMPFSPVQIILLELFMDLAASSGFVAEPGEPDVKTRRPIEMTTRILDGAHVRDLALKGAFLFAAVIAAYVFAGTRGLTSAQQGSLAFAAWMIGHVALAFVSRSDREPLASVGLFSNRVVDAWALSTAVLLLVGMYVPGIASRIDLTPVPIGLLLLTAVVVVAWMLLLEVRKYVRSARKSPEAVAA
jgi:Ca2+-transporting ATPase